MDEYTAKLERYIDRRTRLICKTVGKKDKGSLLAEKQLRKLDEDWAEFEKKRQEENK